MKHIDVQRINMESDQVQIGILQKQVSRLKLLVQDYKNNYIRESDVERIIDNWEFDGNEFMKSSPTFDLIDSIQGIKEQAKTEQKMIGNFVKRQLKSRLLKNS